jgi:hypothetical protein
MISAEDQALLMPLQEEINQLKKEALAWKQKYFNMLEQFKLAQQRQYSSSSESNILQGELQFDEAESIETTELPQEDNTVTVIYARKKPVRRPLPAELPRETIEHDIAEEDKLCACGCMKQRIGEEVTEQLEFVPAKRKRSAKYRLHRMRSWIKAA